MEQIITFAKYILHSNIINFLLMVWILYAIVKKLNLGKNFDSSIDSVKAGIQKSDDEKARSEKLLNEAKALIDKLPDDIKTLEKNNIDKVEVFKNQIKEDTHKTIFNMQKNIERAISIEEKKISNLMQERTSCASVELAKQYIVNTLKDNPELHNHFIQSSLDELERVKL